MEVPLKYEHAIQTVTIPDENYIGELNLAIDPPGAGGWFTLSYMKP